MEIKYCIIDQSIFTSFEERKENLLDIVNQKAADPVKLQLLVTI